MWVMLCDGCKAADIDNNLTEDREGGVTTVPVTESKTIHLCRECSDIYFAFKAELRTASTTALGDFRKRQEELKESLWEAFRNAKKEKLVKEVSGAD